MVACLVEGNSIRATSRMTGVARNTVDKLLIDLGATCSEFQDKALRNLSCKRLQCDEIWSFVGCKEKNVPDISEGKMFSAWLCAKAYIPESFPQYEHVYADRQKVMAREKR